MRRYSAFGYDLYVRGTAGGVRLFPLLVDYEERFYAAGKIPGGFIKREGAHLRGQYSTPASSTARSARFSLRICATMSMWWPWCSPWTSRMPQHTRNKRRICCFDHFRCSVERAGRGCAHRSHRWAFCREPHGGRDGQQRVGSSRGWPCRRHYDGGGRR